MYRVFVRVNDSDSLKEVLVKKNPKPGQAGILSALIGWIWVSHVPDIIM